MTDQNKQEGKRKTIVNGPVFLLLFALVVTGLMVAGTGKKPRPPTDFEQIKIWHEKTREHPWGVMEVPMNGERLKVPGEYVGQGFVGRVFFDAYVYWPEMTAWSLIVTKDEVLAGLRDQVRLLIDTKEPPAYDKSKYAWRFEDRAEGLDGPYVSVEAPNLLEYRYISETAPPDPWLFVSPDSSRVGPDGERLFISCHFDELPDKEWPPKLLPQPECRAAVYWPNGAMMKVRLFRRHLAKGMDILEDMIALRDSWVVEQDTDTEILKGK